MSGSSLDNAFNDFFYESRIIKFINLLINNSIPPKAINQFEVELLKEKERILNINEFYDGLLIKSMNDYSKFIQPKDAITFLIEADNINKTETAKEIMDWTVKEKATMTFEQLFEAFNEFENMPVFFLPTLIGTYNEDGRLKPESYKASSGLNLDAMNKFK